GVGRRRYSDQPTAAAAGDRPHLGVRPRLGFRASAFEPLKLLDHALEHAVPIAGLGLAKETHAGIPGRIFAIQEPYPVRAEGYQEPARPAQRASQVPDRTVYRDDQVQAVDERGGVGEIGYERGGIENRTDGAQFGEARLGRVHLKAHQLDLW